MKNQFSIGTIGIMAVFALLAGGYMVGPLMGDSTAQEITLKEAQAQINQPGFVHVVYFWMKDDAPEAAVDQLIADCKKYLGKVETVKTLYVGRPAGTKREVVDNSYAVNLIVHFKDKAAHDYYQQAEPHQQFIERNEEHWERVQVYDMRPE